MNCKVNMLNKKIEEEIKEQNRENKMNACCYLADLNDKKITRKEIKAAALKFLVPLRSLERAWKNFQETGGKFDLRFKTGTGTLHGIFPTHKAYSKRRDVSIEEAGDIIRFYMTTKITSRELSNLYKISITQFYEWIKELTVSGELMGQLVLDFRKYAKLPISDVIWLRKYPKTQRKSISKLSTPERQQYYRVGTVLLKYLPTQDGEIN